MDSSRTYVFVRLWEHFGDAFPAAAFDAIADEDLGPVLEHLALSLFVRPLEGVQGEWERRVRARGVPAQPVLSDKERLQAGVSTVSVLMDNGFALQAPAWQLVHVEDSEEKADLVIDALQRAVRLSCQARFRRVSQGGLEPRDWLLLERAFDRFYRPSRPLKPWERVSLSPLNRLRLEAQDLSRALQRGMAGQGVPPRDATEVGAERAAETSPLGERLGTGFFSAAELAAQHQVDAEALRKRLERWRRKNPGGSFIEDVERKSREPGFLYLESEVHPLIQSLKRASDKASGKRPALRKKRT